MVGDGVKAVTVRTLKANSKINTDDSQNLTDDGDEGPWREVDGSQRRQVCGGLTGCRGI